MTVRTNTGTSIGTIQSGSGNSWVVSSNGTLGPVTMYAATVGASVPTATDSVFFNTPYSQSISLSGALNCLNFTISVGATTLTNSGTINIRGSFSIASGTNWSALGTITFSGTGAQTITSSGVTISSSFTFNSTGSWALQDALTFASTATVTLTAGTLNLNNKTLITGLFNSNNSTTRAIDFGTTGVVQVIGSTGNLWNTSTVTGLTVSGTPVVNVTKASGATTILPGALNETSSISFNINAGNYALTFLGSAHAAKNVNFTGFNGSWTATSTATVYGNLTLSTGMTIVASTSVFTFAGTSGSKTINANGRFWNTPITFNGNGSTWTLQNNLNISANNSSAGSTRAVTLSGGTLNLGTFTLYCGTFTSTTGTRTLNFGTGSVTTLSSGTVWNTNATLTVSGTPIVNINTAAVTANTINVGTPTEANTISFVIGADLNNPNLTLTAGNYGSINLTNYTGELQNTAISVFGDYTFGAGMSFSATITNATTFASTSGTTRIIRSNAEIIPFPIIFNGIGGSWSLFDSLNCGNTATGITWTNGNIDLNNNNLTLNEFTATATGTFTFGTGTVIINSTSGTSNVSAGSGITYATAGSTYTFTGNVNPHTINQLGFSGTTQPKIVLPATSSSITLGSVEADINTTGFTGTLTLSGSAKLYNTTITSGLTLNASGVLTFATTTASDTAVSIIPTLATTATALNFSAQSGRSITLQTNITIGSTRNTFFGGAGTTNLNGFTLTTGTVLGNSGSITMNNGNIIVTRDDSANGGPVWVDNVPGKVDFNDATGSIQFSSSSPKSMDTDTTSVLPTIAQTGTGNFTLTNTNGTVLNGLNVNNISSTGGAVSLGQALTFYFTDFTLSGCILTSTNNLIRSTVSKTSGTVSVNNLTISGIRATGGAVWNAFTSNGNVDGGDNSGWNFSSVVSAVNSAFFLLF
jgi:hypothetical protein